MNKRISELGDIGGTSYIPLSINHASIVNIKNTEDNFSAMWCILTCLNPIKTNVSLTSRYIHNIITI